MSRADAKSTRPRARKATPGQSAKKRARKGKANPERIPGLYYPTDVRRMRGPAGVLDELEDIQRRQAVQS